MRSVFAIPVFNQVRELPRLLEELAQPLACDEVVFINNGSSDGSEDLLRASGRPVIEVPENQGIGYSLQLAADWALERRFDVFGVMAGNGKMDPAEMPRLLAPVEAGEADFVWGSRFLDGGDSPNLPSFRKSAIPMVNRYVQLVTGRTITDATCGYTACRAELFDRARFDWRAKWLRTYGFEYYFRGQVMLDPTIRWREVPVSMRYPKTGPYSKIKPVVGWWAMMRPWLVAAADRKGFAPAAP